MKRKIFAFLALVILTYTWLDFLWRPFELYLHQPSATAIGLLLELLKPVNDIYRFPFGGWLFLLVPLALGVLLLAFARWISDYLENSFVPISVLETKMTLILEDDNITSRLIRRQLYHANKPEQYAYHSRSSINAASGTIESVDIVSRLNGTVITREVLTFGGEKATDIIETFNRALPTNLIVSLLPDSFVLFLYRQFNLFKNLIVERNSEVTNKNEYNDSFCHLSLTSLRYPVTNVSVTLNFPQRLAPPAGNLKVYVVRENIADPKSPTRDEEDGRVKYAIALDRFFGSTIRAYWHPIKR